MTVRITETENVTKFRHIAKTFCNLVQNSKSVKIARFFHKLEILLPLLCSTVQSLPEIERSPIYKGKWSHKKWQKLFITLRDYLGKYDYYCHVYDPYNSNEKEPLMESLSDDLADICRDLSPGLMEWNHAGSEKRRAIVDNWKLMYDIHWGCHALSASLAIHWLVNFYEVGTKYEDFKGHIIKKRKKNPAGKVSD